MAWLSQSVVNAVQVLRWADKGKFRSPNFIRGEVPIRAIAHEPIISQFARLAFRAYLFALRVPSEDLPGPELSPTTSLVRAPKDRKSFNSRPIRRGRSAPSAPARPSGKLPTGAHSPPPLFLRNFGRFPKASRLIRKSRLAETDLYPRAPVPSPISRSQPLNINGAIRAVFANLNLPRAEGYPPHTGFAAGILRSSRKAAPSGPRFRALEHGCR